MTRDELRRLYDEWQYEKDVEGRHFTLPRQIIEAIPALLADSEALEKIQKRIERLQRERDRASAFHESAASKLWDAEQEVKHLLDMLEALKPDAERIRAGSEEQIELNRKATAWIEHLNLESQRLRAALVAEKEHHEEMAAWWNRTSGPAADSQEEYHAEHVTILDKVLEGTSRLSRPADTVKE